MTSPRTRLSRLLDRIEHLLWHSQDERLRADGWDVIRVSRWRRQYRHPYRFAALQVRRDLAARRSSGTAGLPAPDSGAAADLGPADGAGPAPLLAGAPQ